MNQIVNYSTQQPEPYIFMSFMKFIDKTIYSTFKLKQS